MHTIHGHYSREIRTLYTVPRYFTYLQDKHQWTPSILEDIDWLAFQQAAKHHPSSATHLLKLVHHKLPTGSEKSKANPAIPSQCHYCTDLETFEHLLRCTNPISEKFRQRLQKAILQYCAQSMATPEFGAEFAVILQDVLCDLLPLHDRPTTPQLQQCVRKQQKIGMHLMLRGFLSKSWRHFYIHNNNMSSDAHSSSTTTFVAGLLATMWTVQTEFWESHLQEINKANTTYRSASATSRQEFVSKIRMLHAKKQDCQHAHRDQYFHTDVENFIGTSSTHQLRQYLHNYERAIYQSIKDARRNPTKSTIFQFPGFKRITSRANTHPTRQPSPHDNEGASIRHKHTRWRQATSVLQSIKNFFSKA